MLQSKRPHRLDPHPYASRFSFRFTLRKVVPGPIVQIPVPQRNRVEQAKHNKTSRDYASATKLLGPAKVRQQGSHLPREKGTVLVHSYPALGLGHLKSMKCGHR